MARKTGHTIQTDPQQDLDARLRTLPDEYYRVRAIELAFEQGWVDTTGMGVKRVIAFYRENNPLYAAHVAQREGFPNLANPIYNGVIDDAMANDDFLTAYCAARDMRDAQRAETIYRKGITDLTRNAQRKRLDYLFTAAGRLAEEHGDIEKAVEFYQRAGDNGAASRLLKKTGDLNRAAVLAILERKDYFSHVEEMSDQLRTYGDLLPGCFEVSGS